MNVSLTPVLEAFVKRKLASGLYGSASEVIREGLRLLESRERTEAQKLDALRAAMVEGVESGPGRPLDMDEVKARGREAQEGQGPGK